MEWVVWVYSVQARTQRHESIVRVTCVLLRVCIDRTSLSFWLIISCNQMTPYIANYLRIIPLCRCVHSVEHGPFVGYCGLSQ